MSSIPRFARTDEVTIGRDGDTAVIDFKDGQHGGVNLRIGSELKNMTDAEVLQLYNEVVCSQLELAAAWRPTEIAEGRPQIKYDRKFRQWSARGHVLRCVIDADEHPTEPVIQIDNHRLSLSEFGAMLKTFNGWGMRIAFVSEDQLTEPPEPEIRKSPKRISKKELAALAEAASAD